MAQKFNMYFVKSAEELTHNFDCLTPNNAEVTEQHNPLYIKEVNKAKVLEIMKFSNSKAKDISNFDAQFMKKYSSCC